MIAAGRPHISRNASPSFARTGVGQAHEHMRAAQDVAHRLGVTTGVGAFEHGFETFLERQVQEGVERVLVPDAGHVLYGLALEPFVARLHRCSPLLDASDSGRVLAGAGVTTRL